MNVAIIGGGNTGCVMAAAFSLRGLQVTLCEKKEYWHEHIDAIAANNNTVSVIGNDLTGDAKIYCITDDLKQTLADNDVIVVALVTWRRPKLYEEFKGKLRAGQTVIFSAGNFSSIQLRNVVGKNCPAIIGEMMGNIFPCRMIGPARAIIAVPFKGQTVSAFPGRDTDRLVDSVEKIFPCSKAKNVFDAALNAPNVEIHLCASLLNLGGVEQHPDFGIYKDGLTEGVILCAESISREMQRLMDRMGYTFHSHVPMLKKLMQYDKYPELNAFRSLEGPDSRLHRYINEDAGCGDSLLLSLAGRLGMDLPVIRAFVTIASAINDIDYATVTTMENLQIKGNTPEEINSYLWDGMP